jgi:hypothetical protein
MPRAIEFHWCTFEKQDNNDRKIIEDNKKRHLEDNVQLFLLDNGRAVLEVNFHGRPEETEYTEGVWDEIENQYGCDTYAFLEANQVPFETPELVTLDELNAELVKVGFSEFVPFYREDAE